MGVKVTEVSPVAPWKAESSIVVTESGIAIVVRLVALKKAKVPIERS